MNTLNAIGYGKGMLTLTSKDAETHFICCYGSLRRGGAIHGVLEGQRFVGMCKTRDKFVLRVAGRLPMVTKDKLLHEIVGELYEVDDECLARLDLIEGHPSFYMRQEVPAKLFDGSLLTVWLYFFGRVPRNAVLVPSGDYFEFLKSPCRP